MSKGAGIKRMVAVRNNSTNTIMEKNKHREEGVRVKDMEFFRGKVKNFFWIKVEEFFWNSPFRHSELHFRLCQPQTH